ncbi:MAG TPA: 23S rRNA (uracil-5-)-methyltransferase RumA, partial [Clostridia bacterium]|nr:23S rRNA (uracil-5-)-methyltransferase RumA [Clostridia bacterium]
MKKGEIYTCTITKNKYPATGICYLENEEIAIPGAFLDEEVTFRLGKRKKGLRTGRLLQRQEAPCDQFDRCGGCISQHLDLEKQRKIKLMEVRDLFKRQGVILEDLTISGSEQALYYRNKVEFNFGDTTKGGPLELGFYERNMGRNVLPTKDCLLVHRDIRIIRSEILAFSKENDYSHYHVMKREGFLRNLVVRRSHYTGEIMVNLVTTTQETLKHDFIKRLLELDLEGEIVSILHTENDSLSNFVYSDKLH